MKFYILFLVTRNAKKAKKKDDADQNPEYETPETDSEKEEGATSTSTSDTEDEEEEAKASNTTSIQHNTKSITTRCVKNFYTNFFNNHKYIFLKIRKNSFFILRFFILRFFIFIFRTDVNSRKRKVPPPQPNNSLTSAKKNTVKRSRKKDRPSVFMTNDNFVPTASNQVVIKRADEVRNIQDFRLFFNEDKTRCVSFMNNTFKGLVLAFLILYKKCVCTVFLIF